MATVIKHVQGNVLRICIPLTLRVVTTEGGVVTETDNDFTPNTDYPARVIFDKGRKYSFEATMTGNVACVTDEGSLPIGVYSVTVLCRNDDGEPMRFKQDTVLNVVDTTAEAGIEPGVEYQAETHYLDAAVFLALGGGGTLPDGIVIDPDYVHTDNNFTNEYKEMLDNMTTVASPDDTPTEGSANAVSSGGVYTVISRVNNALAGKQDTIAKGSVTIAVSDWSSNAVTVTATGVTASNVVIVSPDSASMADYAAAGVQCTAQGANTLTFSCTSTPTSSLTINYIAI